MLTDLPDELTQAVLARDEVARYLRTSDGEADFDALEKIIGYLDELRTTQRYPIYRRLKHPLYPILRKVERLSENIDVVKAAARTKRLIYASNHKSHIDYLAEPLVLDDNGVRPPVIAAGINLFGGPLGLLHRHITGAIPIRRNVRDPAYLITLRAYVAELLKRHDFMFYIEGGRSYSGELRPAKTGLFHAALQTGRQDVVIVPTAISYDLVLEDHVLARQGVKRRQRPFSRELAEMARYAVGYRSRAIVTFGDPISLGEFDPSSRRDVLSLVRRTRRAIGLQIKVLPTTLVAAAMRPSITRAELESRIDGLLDRLRGAGANLGSSSGAHAAQMGCEFLDSRHVIALTGGRIRVRDRHVLRYYARMIEHLLAPGTPQIH
jgi:glycerol-3-phosphate O-acyltransferase